MAEYKKYNGTAEGHPMLEEKKDPTSGALPNQKTDFRFASSLDHSIDSQPVRAEFAYPGTDKGVAGQSSSAGNA